MVTVALHCGQPATAVRHAYQLLKEMKETGNTQVSNICLCLGLANSMLPLLKLGQFYF